ncbi:MAG: LON peptidase substrate-binding domain-containing protein [Acidimicrobiales bacterium]
MSGPETRELPMFPLGSVLFPGTGIPLQVFEPRYKALTGWCLEHDGALGIVLIERGSEVGGGDVRFRVGTQGRITQSAALPDGRWLIVVAGERRIRINRWRGEEPFPRAEVTFLDERPGGTAEVREEIVAKVHRALALKVQLQEWHEEVATPGLDPDPATAGWQAASVGLLTAVDCQRLLETDSVDERLAALATLLDEEIDVLALRAAGR